MSVGSASAPHTRLQGLCPLLPASGTQAAHTRRPNPFYSFLSPRGLGLPPWWQSVTCHWRAEHRCTGATHLC